MQCTVLNRQSLHYAAQVSFDLLDNYPGAPYKSRGGSIKRTRFVEEEEDEDDEDDAVSIGTHTANACSMHAAGSGAWHSHFRQPQGEAAGGRARGID